MSFEPWFINHDIIKGMSAKQAMDFAFAVFSFQEHDVLTVAQAQLLHSKGLLKVTRLSGCKLWDGSDHHCCVRFTTDGLVATQLMLTGMGLSGRDLKSMPDQYEDDVSDNGLLLKFVMHDRRLQRELTGTAERIEATISRYAFGFEEELAPRFEDNLIKANEGKTT